MKNILFIYLLLLSGGSFAQPVITAATNNPVPGEIYTVNSCDKSGVTQGSGGAAVTWDFHTLSSTLTYPYHFVSCVSTPYCDSFLGSNLSAEVTVSGATNYEYFYANTTVFQVAGNHYSISAGFQYFYKPEVIWKYPVVYGSIFKDTNMNYLSTAINYNIVVDSNVIDGYGTLILPSGTFTNVLRQHTISVTYDSIPGTGVNYSSSQETYQWFAPGYHFLLLSIQLDSSSGTGLGTSFVIYTSSAIAGTKMVANENVLAEISPNPASEVLNIKFYTGEAKKATVTLSDITGKTVGKISSDQINNGANDIQYPVADLPSGLYLIHLCDGVNNVTKKVVIAH